MDGGSYGPQGHRWLNIAERLLAARDLQGAKTFAILARESEPPLDIARRMVAVVDVLIAGNTLASKSRPNYYAILQLPGWTQNLDLVSIQYRKLVSLLDPNVCKISFTDQALRLVNEAWAVLSSPEKKLVYDSQLGFNSAPEGSSRYPLEWQQLPRQRQLQELFESSRPSYAPERGNSTPIRPSYSEERRQQQEKSTPGWPPSQRNYLQEKRQDPVPNQPSYAREKRRKRGLSQPTYARQKQQEETEPVCENPRNDEDEAVEEEERPSSNVDAISEGPTFWTKCPFCFCLYEYPKKYEECTLRCRYCRRAFQAVVIESPAVAEKDGKFCCWGYFPVGFSGNVKNLGGFSGWSPISPMFVCPIQGYGDPVKKKIVSEKTPRFVFNDDDVFVEVSDPSDDLGRGDDDDQGRSEGKRAKIVKGKNPFKVRNTQMERVEKMNHGNAGSVESLDWGSMVRASNSLNAESSRIGVASSGKKQVGRGAKDWGRLDLNLEFSNEVEEPVAQVGDGRVAGNGVDPNIEGTGFFEGLDEFLSTLPILR